MASKYEILNINTVLKSMGEIVKAVTDGKVDKAEGQGLISDADKGQITTNKTDLQSLTTRVQTIETQLEGLAQTLEELI